ncbi:FtsX-like permease family protein [Spirosoma endbachense]|uniref:FtsX-like permease family protein n=2 Tax=Spirosoma endbachense TaxID=2666025 RepID=A0A6P1WBA3_9BACT|nr:FtsX-like permease family protein [Spirosoma endbachense]
MIRNYLTIAGRNLVKNRAYSVINILGLAVGMAVAILIGLWVNDEWSANKHHLNYQTLYQLKMNQTIDGYRSTGDALPFPIGPELKAKYPDFKAVAMCDWGSTHSLIVGNHRFLKSGRYIGPDAITMFSLKVLKGDQEPLNEPYSIVLTDQAAQTLFGQQEPIGQLVKLDNQTNLKVTAIVAKQPHNASLQFDYLLPWDLQLALDKGLRAYVTNWDNSSWACYVQLKEGIRPENTNAKLKDLLVNHLANDPNTKKIRKPEVFLFPMEKWRLYSNFSNGENTGGFIQYVRLFSLFGFFIVVIACINFMNLSTARSQKRAKEVGVRKAVGSGRQQLIGQFLSESILMASLALVLALGLVGVGLPFFNTLTEKQLVFPLDNHFFWGILLLFTVFTGVLAGSYPALYLSSFKPVTILKGSVFIGKQAALPRKILVITQFTCSMVLMIGSIVVYQQIQHGKNRPIGFTKSGLISVSASPDLLTNFNPLRTDLLASGAVSYISQSNTPPTALWSSQSGWEWSGSRPEDKAVSFKTIATTYDYLKTMGIQFKAGRDFSRAFATDSSGVLLNEAAAKRMGLKEPLGERLKWDGQERRVVGIIPDILMESPFHRVSPMIIVFYKDWVNVLCLRINPALSPSAALAKMGPIFDKYNPGYPFDYKFADTEYAKKFNYEELIGNFSVIVTVLTLLITCLGLFGLASFLAEQRTKEIGIRKVLGASVANIWGILSKDFLQLVLISCLVASPIAYYALGQWLKAYSYKIQLEVSVFILVLLLALLITLLTISYQSIKAALMNPVKSLRSE